MLERDSISIYVVTFANVATGGVELCHQLVYKLNLLGYQAKLIYYKTDEKPFHFMPEYEKYRCPYITELVQDENAYYVIPEGMGILYHQIESKKKIFWWLSVDNFCEDFTKEERDEWMNIPHLVQSEYARQYLVNNLRISPSCIYWLSDYVNSEYLMNESEEERDDIVLFNPKKGPNESAMLFINSMGKIIWQALRGLQPNEMKRAMNKAKVYIDFGNHPGKDRIPREAALNGLCVITNTCGAAGNKMDVEIPEKYKFEEFDVHHILNQIYELCDQYEERKLDYQKYIEKTKKEFQEFECDAYTVFQAVCQTHESLPNEEELLRKIRILVESEEYEKAFCAFIQYRTEGYIENLETDILEVYIRIGLGEMNEAKYLAFSILKENEDCYELYMLLAKIYLLEKNTDKFIQYRNMAIERSMGTEDEAYIRDFFAVIADL